MQTLCHEILLYLYIHGMAFGFASLLSLECDRNTFTNDFIFNTQDLGFLNEGPKAFDDGHIELHYTSGIKCDSDPNRNIQSIIWFTCGPNRVSDKCQTYMCVSANVSLGI